MSIIPLAETKKVYDYNEVMGQTFSIPIPRNREYTSPKERNGYEDQTFSSNDMLASIVARCFAVTKYSPDGKIHPVCFASQNLIDEFWLQGIDGFLYGPDELNLICRIFGRQKGLVEVRSVNYEDKTIMELKYGDFWLASRAIDVFSNYQYFRLRFVGRCNYESGILYRSYGDIGVDKFGVRQVFVLKSEVKFPEPKISWVIS